MFKNKAKSEDFEISATGVQQKMPMEFLCQSFRRVSYLRCHIGLEHLRLLSRHLIRPYFYGLFFGMLVEEFSVFKD